MHPGPPHDPRHHPTDAHSLGPSLAPVLAEACGGRLGTVEWFRSAWQHSGASTGFATWQHEDGSKIPVMVKVPVGAVEYRWTTALAAQDDPVTPVVLAAGERLGDYDLAWLVVERLEGPPLSQHMTEEGLVDLLHAAADFHAHALAVRPPDPPPPTPNWESLLEKARSLTRQGSLHEPQRWNEAVKKVQRALPVLQRRWAARRTGCWCHGDLHPGNAMRRSGEPRSPSGAARHRCVLIDLALVHAGHWVEDAVYLERLYWGRTEHLHGVKPVSVLARVRRERGMPTDDAYSDLAMVRRVLMAACVPVYAEREGHHLYTHAALEIIEKGLPQVAH